MDPLIECPRATALTTIPTQACDEIWDQIQKFAFQRRQATPSFTSTTIKAQATWTPLLTAADSTKIVITPFIPGVTIPAGEILKEGGNDNTTISGVPRVTGRGFVAVTTQLRNSSAAVRTAIRKLFSESSIFGGSTDLWVYFFNRFNQIIANADGSGFDVHNVIVGDVGSDGFGAANNANMPFDLPPGWSDNAMVHVPTAPFKPLNL